MARWPFILVPQQLCITVLCSAGTVLELHAREQTSGAITALLNLCLKTARRLDHDGHETDINAEDVLFGR